MILNKSFTLLVKLHTFVWFGTCSIDSNLFMCKDCCLLCNTMIILLSGSKKIIAGCPEEVPNGLGIAFWLWRTVSKEWHHCLWGTAGCIISSYAGTDIDPFF